jgi:hypothetical protein
MGNPVGDHGPYCAEMIFEWRVLEQTLFEGTGKTGAR